MSIDILKKEWHDWKIGEVLGEGSYGKVFKAEKTSKGFTASAAIKMISIPSSNAEIDALRSEGMTIEETKKYFENIATDFINEIKVMNTLKGAPNIVSVEDFLITENKDTIGWNIFIRMELLRSFKSYLDEHTPSEEEVIKIGIDIATALEVCESKSIIHRDIKPANIFIDDFGNFRLGDFGIAKELEKTSGAASMKGTFSFMAPEVAQGKRYDLTVDIYSLGLVLYSLLNNNRPPFTDPYAPELTYNDRKNANDRRLAGEPLPAPCNASPELANIILCACAFDPSKRFKTPTALKNALRSCGKNGAIPFTVPNKPKDSIDETVAVNRSSVMPAVSKSADFTNKKKSSKKPLIILLTILIAAICIAVGALLPSLLNKNNDADEQKEENISSDKKTEEDINDDASIDFLTDNTDTAANSDIIHNNAIPDITENSENIITPDTEDTEPDPIPPEEPAVQGNTTWNLKDGILTISGSGDMDNYSDDFDVYYEDIEEYAYTNSPWDYHRFDITEVIIEDGVTSVGNNAFYGCNKLTKVTLPESITKIGNYAFSSTDSLQNIDIPSKVTTIGEHAFSGSGLMSIYVPKGVTTINNGAFASCFKLSSVILPEGLTHIGSNAFDWCTSLTSIVIPEGIKTISSSMFYDCSKLTSVTIPSSVETIEGSAFFHCDSLLEITIPATVTKIKKGAFDTYKITFACYSGTEGERYAIDNEIQHYFIG
ncbi:MAG: hypothetical protein E7652_01520 [Ruminococcaceae bacterium]|nr:hypothetical protein [Oscillospiraceae bacterium]